MCTRHGSRAAPLTGLWVAEATTQGPWLPGKNRWSKLCLLVATVLPLFLELPCTALSKSDKVQMAWEPHSSLSWWKLKTDEGQWFSHPLLATRQDGSPEATKTQTFPVLLNYGGNTDTPLKSPVKSGTSPCRNVPLNRRQHLNFWKFSPNEYCFSHTSQSLQWLGSKSRKSLHLKKEKKRKENSWRAKLGTNDKS